MVAETAGTIPVSRRQAVVDILTMRCAREQIGTPGGIIAIIVGLAASLVLLLAQGGGAVMAGQIATNTSIKSVTARTLIPDRPPVILTVRMDAPISSQCTRQGFTIAWLNVDGGEDEFWPTGASMQGGPHQPTADREGRVLLIHYLVAGMEPGREYKWRLKTVSRCSWLGGLIWREKHEQSPVMTFTVP